MIAKIVCNKNIQVVKVLKTCMNNKMIRNRTVQNSGLQLKADLFKNYQLCYLYDQLCKYVSKYLLNKSHTSEYGIYCSITVMAFNNSFRVAKLY